MPKFERLVDATAFDHPTSSRPAAERKYAVAETFPSSEIYVAVPPSALSPHTKAACIVSPPVSDRFDDAIRW
jgi:hypothetical protein